MDDKKSRIDWIDSLKGFGIILVILGHAGATPTMFYYIFSFHMALFFFVSGYLFVPEKHPNFLQFLKGKAKTILIPYLCFSVISMAAQVIYVKLGIAPSRHSAMQWLQELFISKRNGISYNVPLWFLTSLFTVEVIYYLLRRYIPNRAVILLILLTLGFFGVEKYQTLASANTLPWTFDATMYFICFYGIASLFREQNFVFSKWEKLVFLAGCLGIHAYSFFKPKLFNAMTGYSLQLTIPILAICGFIFLSITLKNRVLQYLGRNSLIIFSSHMLVLQVFFYMHEKYQFGISFDHGKRDWVNTVAAIIVLIPCVYIINRYLPFVLGRFRIGKQSQSTKGAAI